MVKKRKTSVGKIKPYIDVRGTKDIPKFESLISTGPVTVVLVYADWCGFCKKLKGEMWDKMATSPNKGVNTAAVHYDMMDKTSIKNTPVEGYPTIIKVNAEPTKNVATPIPTPQNETEMAEVLNINEGQEEPIEVPNDTPFLNGSNEVRNLPSNFINANVKNLAVLNNKPNNINYNNVPNNQLRTVSLNSYKPQSLPPNMKSDDYNDAITTLVETQKQKGGSLMESLLKVAADSAHAVVLAGSAAEIAQRMKKRRTKKAKHSGKKKTRKH